MSRLETRGSNSVLPAWAGLLLATLACSITMIATTARATDVSDLWWNESENGWGVNVSHQGDILFLTFFVYDRAGQPIWYSASSTEFQGANSSGGWIYQGALFQTSGPWLGGSFDPRSVLGRQVGTVTFTLNTITTASLTYTVDGVSVSKSISRLTFRNNPYIPGRYLGGWVATATGCTNSGVFNAPATVTVSGTPSSTTISLQLDGGTCTFTGRYTQSGRMGAISGPVSCTTGARGTASIAEIEANASGLTARYTGDYGLGCTESGRFGGLRDR